MKSKKSSNLLPKIIVLSGCMLTLIFLNLLPKPFIWIYFLWFIVLLFLAKSSKKSPVKLFIFYTSFIPFTFGIYEAILWIKKAPEVYQHQGYQGPGLHQVYPEGMIDMKHEILGYAPHKNTRPSHARYYKNQLIFNVSYTIDAHGLRISPPYNRENNRGSILFFGGSFTFGVGVKDEETLPYLTGLKTQGKYRIYNLAFRGYGPHQMLSAIQHHMVENIVKVQPRYAIYQALLEHIARAAGLMLEWDKYGPKYILNEKRQVIYDGHFNKDTFLARMTLGLKKSKIFAKMFSKGDGFDKDQVDLFIEIVHKAGKLLEERYPGCEFHVILWDNKKHKNNSEVLEKLKAKGIRLHLISSIFENSKISFKYPLLKIKYDGHPSPLAHEVIAQYVVDRIIKE